MKQILRLEYLSILAFSIFLFNQTSYTWWWYLAMILLPDIGMIGYIWNSKVGAFTYNISHHLGIGFLLLIVGATGGYSFIHLLGIIVVGHIGLDRCFGYGLKYDKGFHFTHLGTIGKQAEGA